LKGFGVFQCFRAASPAGFIGGVSFSLPQIVVVLVQIEMPKMLR
jgi:hypothetical protein